MAIKHEHIAEADYNFWISPRQAILRLDPIGRPRAFSSISGWLWTGSIETAARRYTFLRDGGIQRAEAFVRMLGNDWVNSIGDDFWATGDVVMSVNGPTNTMNIYGRLVDSSHYQGIRLGPGFDALESQVLPPRAPKTVIIPTGIPKDHSPKISSSQLREWTQTYFLSHPTAKFDDVRDAARAAFPNLQVGERPVKAVIADLGRTLTRGNPSTLRYSAQNWRRTFIIAVGADFRRAQPTSIATPMEQNPCRPSPKTTKPRSLRAGVTGGG